MQKELSTLIEKIAEENNLPVYVVEEIFNHQWKFTAASIKEDNTKTIMLPSFGKFTVSLRKLNWIRKHAKRKSSQVKD
jgi:hypothetical protein